MSDRIRVAGSIVEIEGDEMAAVIWRLVREELILPFVEVDLVTFDLSLLHREATADRVTHDAAAAIAEHRVGVKCSTITPDAERVREFGLSQRWRSPNATIRRALGGTIFREPVVIPALARFVPGWARPIVIGRHAFGDQYLATDFGFDGPGTLSVAFVPDGGGPEQRFEVRQPAGGGVAQLQFNLDESIRGFARAAFARALQSRLPLYLSTKNTVLREYDARFVDIFRDEFESDFAMRFREAGLTYEHRLIDDMIMFAVKGEGGFLWACKNYDGDVVSDMVGQGFGSPGLMTSALVTPDGGTVMAEAAHGTVARHFARYRGGEPASANPIATVFAWTSALRHRAFLGSDRQLVDFCEDLERAVAEAVAAGAVTPDLLGLAAHAATAVDTAEMVAAIRHRMTTPRSG